MRTWLAPAYKLAIGEFATINTENSIAGIGRVFQEYWPICPLRELIMDPGLQLRTAGGSPNQGSPSRRLTGKVVFVDELIIAIAVHRGELDLKAPPCPRLPPFCPILPIQSPTTNREPHGCQ